MQITPRGAFDLGQSMRFGFGQREPDAGGDVMRLGFVLDGYDRAAAAAVRQQADGGLDVEVVGGAEPAAVAAQVARILSVDIDATGWDRLLDRDQVLGLLRDGRPGLRPPLFHSAYEAVLWAVLSARRSHAQAARTRLELARAHGTVLSVAGAEVEVVPTPRQLLGVESFPGLSGEKVRRLHSVARAALDGRLDTATLRAAEPTQAAALLRELDGIGPFYAELVVVRALGHTDVVPTAEPRLLAVAGELLGSGGPLTPAELIEHTSGWTPWRTWACVLMRAAGPPSLSPPAGADAPAPGRAPLLGQASATRSA